MLLQRLDLNATSLQHQLREESSSPRSNLTMSMFSNFDINFDSTCSSTNKNKSTSSVSDYGFSNSSNISIPGLPTLSASSLTTKKTSNSSPPNSYFPLISSGPGIGNGIGTVLTTVTTASTTSNHSLTKSDQSYSPVSSITESNANANANMKSYHPHGPLSHSHSHHIAHPHAGNPYGHSHNTHNQLQGHNHNHAPSAHSQLHSHPNPTHPSMQVQVQPDHNHPHMHAQPHSDLATTMHGLHLGPMDPLETLLGPFPGVRVRGLPYDAILEDILLLFQGLVILDIVVVGNAYGQGAAEAFVVFQNPMDYQMALQRNRQPIRHGTYVDIYQGKRSDYHAAITAQYMQMEQQGQGDGHRPQLQSQENTWASGGSTPNPHSGVPTQSLMSHPAQMNQGGNMGTSSAGGYKLPSNAPGGQNTGTYKGPRPGRGESRNKGNSGRGNGRGGGIQVGDHTGYLRMRGLPFTSTKKEIFDFFSDYDPVEATICLTYRSDGRATGEGYIAFNHPDDAKEAMGLHRNTMGSRYIELFISNKEEHGRAQAREP